MTKKLKSLTFILFFVALLVGFLGCGAEIQTNKELQNQTQQPVATTTEQTGMSTQTTPTKPDVITLTKDKDGWKAYTNTDWGVRFRFKDENDEVEVDSDSLFITLKGGKYKANPLIYISRSKIEDMPYPAGKKYHKRTLKEAIEDGGWFDFEPQYKLLRIEDITTRKKVTGYKVFTLADFSSQGGGNEVVMKDYYFNYSRKFLDLMNFDYIHMRFVDDNSECVAQILDSLEFFD